MAHDHHRKPTRAYRRGRGKYAPLYHHLLSACREPKWRTTFAQIESVLGFRLPDSARRHRPWWSNLKTGNRHNAGRRRSYTKSIIPTRQLARAKPKALTCLPSRAVRWLAGVLLFPLVLGIGPCGRLPGGKLFGNEATQPVADWSFVNDAGLCALEVNPEGPHSVTLNCMSWAGRLFVSCSHCQGKTWSSYVLQNPAGRIEIGDRIYPVSLARLQAPTLLDEVWVARANKVGVDPSPRPNHWWSFELSSR